MNVGDLKRILATCPDDTLIMGQESEGHRKYILTGHQLMQRNEVIPPRYTLIIKVAEL